MSSLSNFSVLKVASLRQASQRNVFSSPWKKSDVVLVVQGKEFHVHRSILTMQSPVFEAMLDGHFKEATQKKITLKGKTSQDMLQFLKLLYPPNMLNEPLVSFTDGKVFKMLALADEYQAENVIKQCLQETKITPENAFKIRPYAVKYNELVLGKCNEVNEVIKRNIATSEIKKEFISGQDKELLEKLLVTKCHFLESVVVDAYDLLKHMLQKALSNKQDAISMNLNDAYCCGHTVSVSDFERARNCQHCLRAYKKSFVDKAMGTMTVRSFGFHLENENREDKLFNTLKNCDDVTTSKLTKISGTPSLPNFIPK